MSTRLLPVGGFLGAGKTTTLIRLAQYWERRGERVAVVTNDQGVDLVDTTAVRDVLDAAVGEVTGGCFCCRFDDLAAVLDELTRTTAPTVVLAEAVGSCTDLQATVVRPLRELHGDRFAVAPLAVLVDPERYRELEPLFGSEPGAEVTDLAHLYRHQLAEADLLVLNKVDRLTAAETADAVQALRRRFPGRPVVPFSALTGAGTEELLATWGAPAAAVPVPQVDYRRYGAAEAELAWTNQTWEIAGPVVPDEWLAAVLRALAGHLAGSPIGHVKIRVATASGAARGSLADSHGTVRVDRRDPALAERATALVNARVGVEPSVLAAAVEQAIAAADGASGARSTKVRGDVFRPAFPVPVHRVGR